MKNRMLASAQKHRAGGLQLIVATGFLWFAMLSPGWAKEPHHPKIVPPGKKVHGKTYDQWAAQWWQDLFAIPVVNGDHPFFSGGTFGGDHKVVFLTGVGGPTTVEINLPKDTAIFFPVLNSECSVLEDPPFHGDDEASLRACANSYLDHAVSLFAEIDGVPVEHLEAYRSGSPWFEFGPLPEGNLFGVPAGTTSLSVEAGIYLFLEPLHDGTHTIHFGGSTSGSASDFAIDTTYVVHVGKKGKGLVVPPDKKVEGKTYGDWANAWWQWVMGIPADRNPLTDETGEFCGEDQHGPVWFLAGTFGNSVERTCQMPKGKRIFMPVFNWIFGAGVFDCDPTVPGVPCDVAGLQQLAAEQTEKAEVLDVTIDGMSVPNVRDYRASSPKPFALKYPDNSVTGVPKGKYSPQVTDGYWLMLEPLPEGEHEIRIHVSAPDTAFGLIEFDIITHLTVGKPKKAHVVPPKAKYRGLSYGEWSAEWWKWCFSLPADRHPLFDTADSSAGQSGNVWFLGGTFTLIEDEDGSASGVVTRDCTVPKGTALFFPILNTECSTVEGNGDTEAELRDCAAFYGSAAMNPDSNLQCTIDGMPVKDLDHYHVQSPAFMYGPLPEDNILQALGLDVPAGTTSLSVSDGIDVMLEPSSAGRHTIHFSGSGIYTEAEHGFDYVFHLDITYHVTVE